MRGTLTDLAETFGQRGTGRGEVTVVVEGNRGDAATERSPQAIETEVRRAQRFTRRRVTSVTDRIEPIYLPPRM